MKTSIRRVPNEFYEFMKNFSDKNNFKTTTGIYLHTKLLKGDILLKKRKDRFYIELGESK